MTTKRLRKSVWELDSDEVKLLTKAYNGIMNLPSTDRNSYFLLAGLHGFPSSVCRHHRQLFLPWHRIYVLKFEDALRSIEGCGSVTLPYLDATSAKVRKDGLPAWCYEPPFVSYNLSRANLTPQYLQDLQQAISELGDISWNGGATFRESNADLIKNLASKNTGIVTGLRDSAIAATFYGVVNDENNRRIYHGFEAPHDTLHVVFGGFDPNERIGWMSNPNTAGFEPIFWFHHSNVERWFKIWQQQNNLTTVASLNANKGGGRDFEIQWKVPFPDQNNEDPDVDPLPWGAPGFSGTFEAAVWQDFVEYTPGSYPRPLTPAVAPAHAPVPAPVTLVTTAAARAIESPPPVQRIGEFLDHEPARAFFAKNVKRSQIKGSFFIHVTFNDNPESTLIVPIFQSGKGCVNCSRKPLIDVKDYIPPGVPHPAKITWHAYDCAHKNVTELLGTPSIEQDEDSITLNFTH